MKKSGKPMKRTVRAKGGKLTIGRERFAKISAVEGIVLTKEMTSRFIEFDRKGMSNEERRRTIIKAYRKA